jgi:hypothetical protein
MPWKPRKPSIHELDLLRRNNELSVKLLRANAELRIKTSYAQRLETLVRERCAMIDTLHYRIDQLREQNKRLDAENEHLVEMVRLPPAT